MAIDASIPLQAVNQVQPPNLIGQATQGLQLKSLVDEDTQRKQQIQQQQALMDAYKTTDTSTDEGKQELIKKVSQINPQMGQKLSADFDTHKEVQAHTAEANAKAQESQMQINDAKMQNIGDVANDILSNYNSIASKAGPQAAWQQVQPVIQQRIQSMQLEKGPDGKPLYSVDELKQFSSVQSPQQLETAASHSHNWFKQKELQNQTNNINSEIQHQIGIETANSQTERERLGLEKERLELSKGSDAATDEQAKAISEGRAKPLVGNALRTAYGQTVMDKVYKMNPKFDATTYDERQKAVKDFGTGKQGQAVSAFNTAISHLDLVSQLSDALDNGDSQLINKIGNKLSEQTGGAAATNFNAAKKIATDEVVKAIIGAGGGVADREEVGNIINPAQSPKQLKGAIQQVTTLMGGKLAALETQYKHSTKLDNFDEMLEPEAKDAFDSYKKNPPRSNATPEIPGDAKSGAPTVSNW
jgi:hypothetical protein